MTYIKSLHPEVAGRILSEGIPKAGKSIGLANAGKLLPPPTTAVFEKGRTGPTPYKTTGWDIKSLNLEQYSGVKPKTSVTPSDDKFGFNEAKQEIRAQRRAASLGFPETKVYGKGEHTVIKPSRSRKPTRTSGPTPSMYSDKTSAMHVNPAAPKEGWTFRQSGNFKKGGFTPYKTTGWDIKSLNLEQYSGVKSAPGPDMYSSPGVKPKTTGPSTEKILKNLDKQIQDERVKNRPPRRPTNLNVPGVKPDVAATAPPKGQIPRPTPIQGLTSFKSPTDIYHQETRARPTMPPRTPPPTNIHGGDLPGLGASRVRGVNPTVSMKDVLSKMKPSAASVLKLARPSPAFILGHEVVGTTMKARGPQYQDKSLEKMVRRIAKNPKDAVWRSFYKAQDTFKGRNQEGAWLNYFRDTFSGPDKKYNPTTGKYGEAVEDEWLAGDTVAKKMERIKQEREKEQMALDKRISRQGLNEKDVRADSIDQEGRLIDSPGEWGKWVLGLEDKALTKQQEFDIKLKESLKDFGQLTPDKFTTEGLLSESAKAAGLGIELEGQGPQLDPADLKKYIDAETARSEEIAIWEDLARGVEAAKRGEAGAQVLKNLKEGPLSYRSRDIESNRAALEGARAVARKRKATAKGLSDFEREDADMQEYLRGDAIGINVRQQLSQMERISASKYAAPFYDVEDKVKKGLPEASLDEGIQRIEDYALPKMRAMKKRVDSGDIDTNSDEFKEFIEPLDRYRKLRDKKIRDRENMDKKTKEDARKERMALIRADRLGLTKETKETKEPWHSRAGREAVRGPDGNIIGSKPARLTEKDDAAKGIGPKEVRDYSGKGYGGISTTISKEQHGDRVKKSRALIDWIGPDGQKHSMQVTGPDHESMLRTIKSIKDQIKQGKLKSKTSDGLSYLLKDGGPEQTPAHLDPNQTKKTRDQRIKDGAANYKATLIEMSKPIHEQTELRHTPKSKEASLPGGPERIANREAQRRGEHLVTPKMAAERTKEGQEGLKKIQDSRDFSAFIHENSRLRKGAPLYDEHPESGFYKGKPTTPQLERAAAATKERFKNIPSLIDPKDAAAGAKRFRDQFKGKFDDDGQAQPKPGGGGGPGVITDENMEAHLDKMSKGGAMSAEDLGRAMDIKHGGAQPGGQGPTEGGVAEYIRQGVSGRRGDLYKDSGDEGPTGDRGERGDRGADMDKSKPRRVTGDGGDRSDKSPRAVRRERKRKQRQEKRQKKKQKKRQKQMGGGKGKGGGGRRRGGKGKGKGGGKGKGKSKGRRRRRRRRKKKNKSEGYIPNMAEPWVDFMDHEEFFDGPDFGGPDFGGPDFGGSDFGLGMRDNMVSSMNASNEFLNFSKGGSAGATARGGAMAGGGAEGSVTDAVEAGITRSKSSQEKHNVNVNIEVYGNVSEGSLDGIQNNSTDMASILEGLVNG